MSDIKVRFPLKGTWQVIASPADRIPSLKTNKLGMSHAYGFSKSEDLKGSIFSIFKKTDIQRTISWSQDVLSPCDGEIVEVITSKKDRYELSFMENILSRLKFYRFNETRTDYHSIFGNYLIIKTPSYYCLLAHLKEGSIKYGVGSKVQAGDEIAKLGYSGLVNKPHLHVQLMDSPKLNEAKGLPACFDIQAVSCRQWNDIEFCVPAKGAVIKTM